MSETKYKKFLQILFYLTLISPLIVDRRLFYPYVTGMALYFRLIVELLFVFWLIFIFLYPKYRPKFNLLIGSVFIYLLALAAAAVFSSNPYLSFWGDAERMLGLFGILHYFALFLIGSSLFREKKEWRAMLIAFTAASLAVCFYGILQRFGLTSIKPGASRILATMGNAGILAAYLIFGLFFSAYLALTEQKINWRWIFGASAAVHLIAVIMTGTRGAYLGVMAGFLFAGAIIIYNLKANKKIIKSAIIAAIALALIYGGLFLSRHQDWVKNSLYLNRLTAFSLSDVTVKTRFMSWRWGLAGWRDKPLLGYGLEQFAVPYNKYFQAEYYNYAAGDTYFDRAHNIVVELLATTGIVGLLAYLMLLSAIFYSIYKAHKNNKDYLFFAAFGGLLIAYFIQNLLIFDLLPALLGFMVLLIVVNNNYQETSHKTESRNEKVFVNLKKGLAVPLALILFIGLGYSYNNYIIKPYKALKDDVAGQVYLPYEYEKGMEFLKRSVSYNTPLDLDLRAAAANTIFNYYRDNQVDPRNIKNDIDFAISLYKENLKFLPDDAYYNYKAGEIMDYRFVIDLDGKILPEAKKYIDKAISLSPNRAEIYYILAENLLMSGKLEEAVAADEKAVELNDKFGQSYWELAKVCYEAAKYNEAKTNLVKAIDLGYRIQEETLVGLRGLFNLEQSIDNEIEFLELIIKNGTKNYLFYSTLANKYYEIGDKEKAIEYAKKSAEINPEVKSKVEKFIENVNNK